MNENITKKYKWHLGDRPDGRKLRSLEPMTVVSPFIMSERNDSTNYFKDCVDMESMTKYIHKKRTEGLNGFGAMHVLVGAYVRTISQKPGLNRFLSGLRIFARKDIQIIMEVKKSLELNAPATMMKFKFSPKDTIYDVYKTMNNMIVEYQSKDEEKNAFDSVAKLLGILPRFILRFVVWILKCLDYNGLLPRFLLDISPFHGSLVITSMASLGIPPIYHHLYNFGNVPVFISFSGTRHEYKLNKDGEVKNHRYFDLNISTDERICDGQYYSAVIKDLKKFLTNPELLDNPPEQIFEDIR